MIDAVVRRPFSSTVALKEVLCSSEDDWTTQSQPWDRLLRLRFLSPGAPAREP